MNTDERLIFLISQPRAGSTMLQYILGSHPEIHTLPEPWLMLHPLYALRRTGLSAEYNVDWAVNRVELFLSKIPNGQDVFIESQRQAYSYLYEQALASSGKLFFLDKTPRYYHVIPELYRVFPKAKYIFLVRNPLAILASILKSWVGDEWTKLQLYRQDLLDAPALLMKGLKNQGVQSVLVHYEDIIANPEETIKCLCDQLNISFYQQMVDYGKQKFPEADWGDQGTVYNETRPRAENKDKWAETLKSSTQWQSWAINYLRTLGPGLIAEMGYAHDAIAYALDLRSKKHSLNEIPWHLAVKDSASYSFIDRQFVAVRTSKKNFLLSFKRIKKTIVNRLEKL